MASGKIFKIGKMLINVSGKGIATKDTTTDIDSLTPEQREAQLDDLELRDISDHKLRKVLRDLDLQTSRLSQDDQACEQGEATAI